MGQYEVDVFAGGFPGEQPRILEDIGDPFSREAVEGTAVGGHQSSDKVQEGGFSASRGTQDAGDLSLVEGEAEITVEGHRPVRLADIFKFEGHG